MPAVFFRGFGHDEHVAGKQAVPGMLGDDTDRQSVIRIGPTEAVLYEDILCLEETLQACVQLIELFAAEWAVVLPPPNVFLGGRLSHDEFVAGSPSGMLSGINQYRTEVRDFALIPEDNFLVERFCWQVPIDCAQVCQTVVFNAIIALQQICLVLSGGLDI